MGGDAWSHENVDPPPQWKPKGAPGAAPCLELLHLEPFGRAPARVIFEAGFLSYVKQCLI